MSIIVLCPVKNEEWILDRFLAVTSHFADVIIVADQLSTDRSREICQQYEKVRLIVNPSETFNEPERQKLLLDAAREYPEPRIILALDADEILSATVLTSLEWQTLLNAPPGTVIQFALVELWNSPLFYRVNNQHGTLDRRTVGYIDDGAEHVGRTIHSERIPTPIGAKRLVCQEIVIMHYALVSTRRYQSRDPWYRCYERITFPERSSLQIDRFYSRYITHLQDNPTHMVPQEWLAGWQSLGIDMTSVNDLPYHWWDWEVLRMFAQHGVERFRHEDIWYFAWEQARQDGLKLGIEGLPGNPVRDPRTKADRILANIRRQSLGKPGQRIVDTLLRRLMR